MANRYKLKWKKLNKQCFSVKETKCRHTSLLEPHGWQCWKPNFFLAHLGTGHHLFFHSLPASDNSRGSQGMRQAGDWPQRSLSGRVLVVSSHHFDFTWLFFISINTCDLFFSALIHLHTEKKVLAARPLGQTGKTKKGRWDETSVGHRVILSARQLSTTLVYLVGPRRPQRWRFHAFLASLML